MARGWRIKTEEGLALHLGFGHFVDRTDSASLNGFAHSDKESVYIFHYGSADAVGLSDFQADSCGLLEQGQSADGFGYLILYESDAVSDHCDVGVFSGSG